ncbi:hypothetical protein J1605_016128 [Eschrichtius robustus]|uniref:Uncharacterized protein n=1 Tax=Eschrichtius robustus TaxID=9764 RepID=A0AB34G7S6_ESCRO|nr:hypothetical protein J1605_016128 [Eschrichtius robustus]
MTPPGEKAPACDHRGAQVLHWSCPRAALCEVRSDCPPRTHPCARTLPPASLQQSPFVELPAAGRHREACTRMSPLAPQELMQAAEEPLPCARCGKRLGPNEQRMGRGPPDVS